MLFYTLLVFTRNVMSVCLNPVIVHFQDQDQDQEPFAAFLTSLINIKFQFRMDGCY